MKLKKTGVYNQIERENIKFYNEISPEEIAECIKEMLNFSEITEEDIL